MEEQENVTVSQVAIKFGLYLGAALVLFSLITFITETSSNTAVGAISYVLILVGIVLAHRAYKEEGNGYMSYGQGLGIGALVGLISGVLVSIFTIIYTQLIDTNYMERLKDDMMMKLQEQGLDDNQIDQTLAMMDTFTNPVLGFFTGVFTYVLLSFLFSLIISIFTKNNEPEF